MILNILHIESRLRQAMYVSATVSNSVYLGVPLVTKAFHAQTGDSHYATIVLIGIMQLLASITFALCGVEYMASRRTHFAQIAKKLATNPLVISLFIGMILSFLPDIPYFNEIIKMPLSMLAATASPVALLVLGAFLYGNHPRQNVWALGFVMLYKLLWIPFTAWLLFGLSTVSQHYQHAMIVYAGMPVAVTAFVVSKQYKLNAAFVGVAMLVTTIVSSITVTILLTVFAS